MIEQYTANVIAENLYSQCDSEGHQFLVLDEIIDHAKDNSAIAIAAGSYTTSANGKSSFKANYKRLENTLSMAQWITYMCPIGRFQGGKSC
jgi:hypothetical protein